MKNKYKYDNIVIHPENSDNNTKIQQILFDFGIVWYSQKDSNETPYVMYTNLDDIVLHINLLEKYITKTDSLSQYIILKNERFHKNQNYDPKIYKLHDIDDIKNIILYGVKKPIYNSKHKIKRILESFDVNKSIVIEVNDINEFDKLKNDLDKWGLKSDNLQHFDNIELEDDAYPISFHIQVDESNYIYDVFPYDPWSEYYDVNLGDYNIYNSIDDFYNDKTAVSYVRRKEISPNYEPKLKPIREFFNDSDKIHIYCKNRHESVEFEHYLHENGFIYNDGKKYHIQNDTNYNKITFIIDSIELKRFYAVTNTSNGKDIIIYSEFKNGVKKFISNPNLNTFNNIKNNQPTYDPKQKPIRESIDYNIDDTTILIFCKNRQESVKFENFLHENNYKYNTDDYYIIRDSRYSIITFILNKYDNKKIFTAYDRKIDKLADTNNSLFIEYDKYIKNIERFVLNPTNYTFKNLNIIQPTYKPKSKIIREFKIFEGTFHDNYNYDTIVVQLNNANDLDKVNEYLKNTFNLNLNDDDDHNEILYGLNNGNKKYIRFIFYNNILSYRYGNLDNLNFNLGYTKYEKLYSVDDLLNDLIQQIMMTGEYKISPSYEPKLKIKRSLD